MHSRLRADGPAGLPAAGHDGPERPDRRRLTVGLFTSRMDRGLHRATWLGVEQAAREQGITAVCYNGGVLVPPGEPGWQASIKEARALLESGTLNVTEVALATGFSDSNYFAKVFRQVVGTSPRAYQRAPHPPA